MLRSRISAAIVAVIMATSALLIPGTAQADVTDVGLTAEFDNLSADRIATVTLKAKSESGITDVRATLQRRVDGAMTDFGTLSLPQVDGTANDGTWKAEYRPDIQEHPGHIWFEVEITSADGATLTRTTSIDNCYETEFADLTTTPEAVDLDNLEITIRGRLLMRKTRESGLEPAVGATVRGVSEASAQTAADGSFELEVPLPSTGVHVRSGTPLCSAGAKAPVPETVKQYTELTARIVTPQPVVVGNPVTLEGRLERRAADGLRPVGEEWVWLDARVGGTAVHLPDPVRTAADGTFRLQFTAEQAGIVILSWDGDEYLHQTQEIAGELAVRQGAQITELSVPGKPAPYGETMRATGRLVKDGTPVRNGLVQLEFAQYEASAFTVAATGRTSTNGAFSLGVRATKSGYWRVRHLDSAGVTLAISKVLQVDVKYKLQMNDLTVRQTGTGGTVTVSGELVRFEDAAVPADHEMVVVYFMPKGGSTWDYQGYVATGDDGSFETSFTATGDGYWTAASWEDADHLDSNAPIVYADVTVQYATEITDFNVTPKIVAAGETITVSGRLTRSSGGDEPAPLANKPIYLYFMPSMEWKQMAVVTTDADGRFETSFTASEGGYWTAWFWGDDLHAKSNPWVKSVDVQ
ncbi:hypothetical protein [Actinomadura sp. WMMB 499]|uniref:hypothetical protein n=1 Tax=Actinomadura sp. WMMB 499 TaxID=1219491 RepID=UPI001246523C|nr:hypothetical protein [Actinomadura sp. WMMB 499]QFG23005.1 hypothetical protein F7P10_19660 [Actinomadura sp. WMMB 499]